MFQGYKQDLIKKARNKGIPVIVATQMLESMIHSQTPTRAEAGDVSLAVRDGSDAVMLSGETSTGEYPVETVAMMSHIIGAAEHRPNDIVEKLGQDISNEISDAITIGAVETAKSLRHVKALIVFTHSGKQAIKMAQLRPNMPIIAITPEPSTLGKLNLLRGVYPVLVTHEPENLGEFVIYASWIARQVFSTQLINSTEGHFYIAMTYGKQPGVSGKTNTIELVDLKESVSAQLPNKRYSDTTRAAL